MDRLLPALGVLIAIIGIASAQPAEDPRSSSIGYPSVAAALDAMRAKGGATTSIQSGWTVIEDRATMSIWSFTPAGHAAHPAAVRRTVTQRGNDIFVDMAVLCEATKPACDQLVAEFQELNRAMRGNLGRRN
jgi:hypothetical protein